MGYRFNDHPLIHFLTISSDATTVKPPTKMASITQDKTQPSVSAPTESASVSESTVQAPSVSQDLLGSDVELGACNILPPIKRFVDCAIEDLKVTDVAGQYRND